MTVPSEWNALLLCASKSNPIPLSHSLNLNYQCHLPPEIFYRHYLLPDQYSLSIPLPSNNFYFSKPLVHFIHISLRVLITLHCIWVFVYINYFLYVDIMKTHHSSIVKRIAPAAALLDLHRIQAKTMLPTFCSQTLTEHSMSNNRGPFLQDEEWFCRESMAWEVHSSLFKISLELSYSLGFFLNNPPSPALCPSRQHCRVVWKLSLLLILAPLYSS